MFYIRMNANPLISSAHWGLTVKGSEKWAMIIRWAGSTASKALIGTSDSYNKKTILQLDGPISKFKKNKAAPMWNFPQHNSTFHPLHVEGSTPRVWGLALLFTIWVAVRGSNFLIKAPPASSETPLLPLFGTTCWALKCKSVVVRIADELRSFMAFQWATQTKANIPAECHCWSQQQQRKRNRRRPELTGDNSQRVCVCVCVFWGIICGTIKWGEPGFKTWCDQRGWGQGPEPEDKRSIWADEEVIIIKPLEVYCPVIKLISKLAVRGCVWKGRNVLKEGSGLLVVKPYR